MHLLYQRTWREVLTVDNLTDLCYNRLMKLTATIHAEHGVSDRSIQAVETGLRLTFRQTGLELGMRATKLSDRELFPTLPSGQVSSLVIAGHPVWDGGGPNVWLTARDLNHHKGTTNFVYGIAGQDGHMAISSHRLDRDDANNPLQLMTVTAHEAGHMTGLVDSSDERHDNRYGFSGHCSNDCTMAASNGMSDTERAVLRMVNNTSTAGFCAECLRDLRQFGRGVAEL